MARSPRRNCWAMNIMIKRPNPSIQPQTFESRQGYVEPPHCKANNKQIMAPIRNKAPTRSISMSLCLTVMPEIFLGGGLKNAATAPMAIAPTTSIKS